MNSDTPRCLECNLIITYVDFINDKIESESPGRHYHRTCLGRDTENKLPVYRETSGHNNSWAEHKKTRALRHMPVTTSPVSLKTRNNDKVTTEGTRPPPLPTSHTTRDGHRAGTYAGLRDEYLSSQGVPKSRHTRNETTLPSSKSLKEAPMALSSRPGRQPVTDVTSDLHRSLADLHIAKKQPAHTGPSPIDIARARLATQLERLESEASEKLEQLHDQYIRSNMNKALTAILSFPTNPRERSDEHNDLLTNLVDVLREGSERMQLEFEAFRRYHQQLQRDFKRLHGCEHKHSYDKDKFVHQYWYTNKNAVEKMIRCLGSLEGFTQLRETRQEKSIRYMQENIDSDPNIRPYFDTYGGAALPRQFPELSAKRDRAAAYASPSPMETARARQGAQLEKLESEASKQLEQLHEQQIRPYMNQAMSAILSLPSNPTEQDIDEQRDLLMLLRSNLRIGREVMEKELEAFERKHKRLQSEFQKMNGRKDQYSSDSGKFVHQYRLTHEDAVEKMINMLAHSENLLLNTDHYSRKKQKEKIEYMQNHLPSDHYVKPYFDTYRVPVLSSQSSRPSAERNRHMADVHQDSPHPYRDASQRPITRGQTTSTSPAPSGKAVASSVAWLRELEAETDLELQQLHKRYIQKNMEDAKGLLIRLAPEDPSREDPIITITSIMKIMNALRKGNEQMKEKIDYYQEQLDIITDQFKKSHNHQFDFEFDRQKFVHCYCQFNRKAVNAMLAYLQQAQQLLSDCPAAMSALDQDETSLKLQCDLADMALKIQCASADDQALNDFRDVTGRQVWPQY